MDWIKKNWVLIAIAVVAYMMYRKHKYGTYCPFAKSTVPGEPRQGGLFGEFWEMPSPNTDPYIMKGLPVKEEAAGPTVGVAEVAPSKSSFSIPHFRTKSSFSLQ